MIRPAPVLRVARACSFFLALLGAAEVHGSLLFADGFEPANPALLDERRLRSAIAAPAPGATQLEWLLDMVGNNGGWPIATATGTFLFAANCGGAAWSLAGDFNAWAAAPMNRHGPLCWAEVGIAAPLEQRYRFVLPGPMPAADPRARRYLYDGPVQYGLVRSDQEHLERWFSFGPQVGLLPRQLQVLVPAGRAYDRVLYMQDGQALFDPNEIGGGWNVQASVTSGVLVVGIDNTSERFDEYTHVPDDIGGVVGGQGDTYAALVHEFVRPWVERRYGPFARQGVLGSSFGGLISLHIADRYPGAYALAGSMSGTLGWGSFSTLDNPTIIERYAASGHGSTAIYLDSGGGPGSGCTDSDGDGVQDDGDDSDNYCVTRQMRDTLAGLGYVQGVELFYVHAPGATHNPSAWGARLPGVLAIFLAL
jgi:hypothetical protein